MNDDYLFDRSGPIEPDVAELERALAPLRYRRDPSALTAPRRSSRAATAPGFRSTNRGALAAALFFVVAVGLAAHRAQVRDVDRWHLLATAGAPIVDGRTITASSRWDRGQWIDVPTGAEARADWPQRGSLVLAAGTRARMLSRPGGPQRVELTRGRIDAVINTAPRLFIVDTPATTAVDLGCIYTLTIDEDGAGHLDVALGAVALTDDAGEVFVPGGARCPIVPGGPGIPWFDDAPDALVAAAERWSRHRADEDALAAIIAASRLRDGLTLWNALPRVTDEMRRAIAQRLVALSGHEAPTSEDDLAAGGDDAIQAWFQFLEPTW